MATLITPREIFMEALKYHAVAVILVHNHPSGDPTPSECDREITERVYTCRRASWGKASGPYCDRRPEVYKLPGTGNA